MEGQTTILIVNDFIEQLQLMNLLFSRAGYRVLIAGDGVEGFEIAQREHPDVVVSDVWMPRADGIQLCRWIRADAALRKTPVLLASATLKGTANVVAGLQAGADDYLEVPFDAQVLLAKVARLVERKRIEEERVNEAAESRVSEPTA